MAIMATQAASVRRKPPRYPTMSVNKDVASQLQRQQGISEQHEADMSMIL